MSITAANAVYLLTIPLLFPAPQQLQGFAADDVFDTDPLETSEFFMGVDGRLSAGFVFVAVRQGISLQADSPSNSLFDAWHAAELAAKEKLTAQGQIILPTINTKWAMTNGFLATFQVIPNAGKTLRPRKFFIAWESVSAAIT